MTPGAVVPSTRNPTLGPVTFHLRLPRHRPEGGRVLRDEVELRALSGGEPGEGQEIDPRVSERLPGPGPPPPACRAPSRRSTGPFGCSPAISPSRSAWRRDVLLDSYGAVERQPYATPRGAVKAAHRIKISVTERRGSIKSHGYQLQPGGDCDPSQFAGVCRRAAGALPARPAGGKTPAAERGGGGHRPPPQGRHSAAPACRRTCGPRAPARAGRAATAPRVAAAAQLLSEATGHIGPHRWHPSFPSCSID